MRLKFYKYQGTGNDFVMVDNRKEDFPKSNYELIARICDRRFGVGADGLILLENDPSADFRMIYYNADGHEGSMCGNGGRCIVAFANDLGLVESTTLFKAVDGDHSATILNGKISLQMQDVEEIMEKPNSFFLDTGSPHHVQMVEDLQNYDVKAEGARLRYGIYGEKGSNINFVEQESDTIFSVRTYERGVENETLSCGTGVSAVALAMHHAGRTKNRDITIKTRGGELQISFEKNSKGYKAVALTGPAEQVFKGEMEC